MAREGGRDWWRRVELLTALFAASALLIAIVLFLAATGAGEARWFGISPMAAVAALLLPVALAVAVFQLAGWLDRNDEHHQLRDDG
jgi:hypothetical protein